MVELVVRLVFSLAVVLALLWACARVAGRRFGTRSGALVNVLHRQSISRSASVTVVNVAGRVLVLGTTDQQVQVLAELDPGALDDSSTAVDETLAEEAAVAAQVVSAQLVSIPPPTPLPEDATPVVVSYIGSHAIPYDASRELAADLDRVAGTARTGRRRAADEVVPVEPVVSAGTAAPRPVVVPIPVRTQSASAPVSVAGSLLAQLESIDEQLARRDVERRAAQQPTRVTAAATRVRLSTTTPPTGRLAGSVLAPATWRQAWGTVTGRAS